MHRIGNFGYEAPSYAAFVHKSGNFVCEAPPHAALDNLLDTGEYKIREGIVLSRNNVERAGKVTYLPIYMAFCLDDLAGEASDADDFTFSPALPG